MILYRATAGLVLVAAAALVLIGSPPAPASVPTVGVADNGSAMFADRNWRALKTKISRKIIPYDFYIHESERAEMKSWMDAAEQAGVEPLVAINHSNAHPRRLPTISSYRRTIRYLREHYPKLRVISAWNEANHRSQPTAHNPRRAAQYYNALRKECRGCKIIAADVLDQKNMLPWLATFKRHAKRPRIWGLHSYVDANHNVPWRRSAARELLRAVRGEVWLTEVGGLVAFADRYSYDERRAARGIRYTLRLALRSKRITRVYLYSWYGTLQPHVKPYRWDSGLVRWNGERRPGYYALRNWLHRHPAARVLK